MKWTLIIPDSPFLIEPRTFPMLGPLYLSAILKKAGHDVLVIDLTGGRRSMVDDVGPGVVGITATTPQFPQAVEILRCMKLHGPKRKVVIGGPHATCAQAECLEAGFDLVVVGEAETIIRASQFEEAVDLPVVEVQLEPLDPDLIPFPDRQAIDLDSYHYYLGDKRATSMITSRGPCPYSCAFCCKAHAPTSRMRFRSSWNVLDEASQLRDMGYEAIMFYDDEMLLRPERDGKIFKGLRNLGMIYRCFTRADLVNEETADLLADTGCYEVLIGCESGSNRILKNIHKGTTREQNLAAIKRLKERGIRVKAVFIVGLPGESWESVNETQSFVEEAKPDDVDFTICTVYPRSPIAENPAQYDINFVLRHAPYKTKPGQYEAEICTSHMSSEDIEEARAGLEERLKNVRPV